MAVGDSLAKVLFLYSWFPLSVFFAFLAHSVLGGATRPQRTLLGAAMPSLIGAGAIIVAGVSSAYDWSGVAAAALSATMLTIIPLAIIVAGYLGIFGTDWTIRWKLALAALLLFHGLVALIFYGQT